MKKSIENLKNKVLKKEPLDIYDIALSNIIINECNWNPKFYSSNETNETKIFKIFKKNMKISSLKSKIEKELLKSLINKNKEDIVLEESSQHKIILSIKNLMVVYFDLKKDIEYIRPFSLNEINLTNN